MKKLFSTRVSDGALTFALLLLRLGSGLLMAVDHGLPKLKSFNSLSGKFDFIPGVSAPIELAMVIFAEFFCAAFIVLGLFTRLACIPLIIAMSVAFFLTHKGNWTSGPGGGQMALLFLICFVVLLFTGPGKASLDRLLLKG